MVATREARGGVLLLVAWLVAALGTAAVALRNPFWSHAGPLTVAWVVAGCAWLGALLLLERRPVRTGWIVAGAIALRLVAFAGAPDLSDDVERYVWEGNLVAEGVSPYAWAPDADEHAARRAELADVFARLNHPEVSAAYPPLTQLALAGVVATARALGGPEWTATARLGARAFFALCDLLVLWPLASLLARAGLPRARLAAWAWCPLVALEFAGSGHFDALGVLLLVGSLALVTPVVRGAREALGVAALAGAVLVKLLPLCAAPFLLRGERVRARTAIALGVGVLLVLPFAFLDGGLAGLGRGLGEYGTRWEGFHFVYGWIEAAVERVVGTDRDRSLTDPRLAGRALVGAVWLGTLVALTVRRAEPTRAVGLLVALFLFLTPTLHPWYLAWIVPFLALRPSAAWSWVVASAPVLYAPLAGWKRESVWEIPEWSRWLVVGPFALLLCVDAARRRAR